MKRVMAKLFFSCLIVIWVSVTLSLPAFAAAVVKECASESPLGASLLCFRVNDTGKELVVEHGVKVLDKFPFEGQVNKRDTVIAQVGEKEWAIGMVEGANEHRQQMFLYRYEPTLHSDEYLLKRKWENGLDPGCGDAGRQTHFEKSGNPPNEKIKLLWRTGNGGYCSADIKWNGNSFEFVPGPVVNR